MMFYGKPLIFSEKAHSYTWEGRKVPSVTTIIGRLGKPALIQWAADMAVGHVREAFEQKAETFVLQDIHTILAAARLAHTKARDDAADIGTLVHKWAQRVQRGETMDMAEIAATAKPELAERILKSLGALREWLATHKLGQAHCERRVFSREHWYAGTTDRWGIIDDKWAVLDFKTGSGIYDEAWYQLAGYEAALREEFNLPPAVHIWHYIIHLDKNTGRCTPHVRGPEDPRTPAAHQIWRSLVALDKAIRAMPKAPAKRTKVAA